MLHFPLFVLMPIKVCLVTELLKFAGGGGGGVSNYLFQKGYFHKTKQNNVLFTIIHMQQMYKPYVDMSCIKKDFFCFVRHASCSCFLFNLFF